LARSIDPSVCWVFVHPFLPERDLYPAGDGEQFRASR